MKIEKYEWNKKLVKLLKENTFNWEKHLEWLDHHEFPFKRPIIMKNGAQIWGYCTIHPEAKIGRETMVGAFTNICGPVVIGDFVRMQGFNYLPQGVTIEDKVFIGPGVVFTNTKYPTSRFGKAARQRIFEKTLVKWGAAIGANAVVCPGVTVGRGSLVAAGSVVTNNVLDGWLVKGNPARHIKVIVDLEEEERQRKAWKMDGVG